MGHKPSIQQKVVYRWVRDGSGNLLLIAVAGSGKTTTILNAASLMDGFVNFCAYNRKIGDEIGLKLKGANMPNRIQAGTFHSFGLRNWRKQFPKVKILGSKVADLCEASNVPEELQEFVVDLVSLGKQKAFGVLQEIENADAWRDIVAHYDVDESLPADKNSKPVENIDQMIDDGIGYTMGIYKKSLSMDADIVDFNDMILAPLIHRCRIWQNDWLLVDEAQDTNAARRELAKRMLKPGGRAIFVGDPAQAIYGFTGADNDSLDIIRNEFRCQDLPLTVTYRCPKRVVDVARQWVKHITAADSAPEGSVTEITEQQFAQLPPELLTHEAVMLCRTTAPLVANAYALIRRGIPCRVEGKKIGEGLIHLIGKWQTGNLDVLQKKMHAYLEKEVKKYLAKKQERKAEGLIDKVECIDVLIQILPAEATVADLKDHIKKLFGDTKEGEMPKCFTLSTVHKSKGREWPTVYLYNRRELMPSRYARQDWQIEQEKNLCYVAVTRAMSNLVEVIK